MRLKIIYTGKPEETKVLNADTGEHINNVIGIDVALDAFNGYVALTFKDFELELDNLEVVDENTE